MPAEMETMVSGSNEVPWHGLGNVVEGTLKWEEAYKLGGLEWTVEKRPLYTSNPTGDLLEISDQYATVRDTDDQILGIVGKKYKIIQNREAFDFMDTIVQSGDLEYHTAGSLFGGKTIWLLAKPTNAQIVIEGTDDVSEPYILLYNAHDGSRSLGFKLTTVRVVCANTLNLALQGRGNSVSVTHTGDIQSKVIAAQQVLSSSIKKFEAYNQLANAFAKIQLTTEDLDEYIKFMLPSTQDEDSTKLLNQRDHLQSLFESGKGNDLPGIIGSAWAALNAVTEYNSHYKGRADSNIKLNSLWWGASEDSSLTALNWLRGKYLGQGI